MKLKEKKRAKLKGGGKKREVLMQQFVFVFSKEQTKAAKKKRNILFIVKVVKEKNRNLQCVTTFQRYGHKTNRSQRTKEHHTSTHAHPHTSTKYTAKTDKCFCFFFLV